MSYESELDMLTQSAKELYLMKHKNKTLEELEDISVHIAKEIYTLDNISAARSLGEIKACNELMERIRKKEAAEIAENDSVLLALRKWNDELDDRRKIAVLNLPAATSYYGQLVAAVLDDAETKLTAEQIRQWADELIAMDDSDYDELLENLEHEKILYKDGPRYGLLTLCTPDLFPSNLTFWLSHHHCSMYGDNKKFFQKMIEKREPATERDWIEITGSSYDIERMKKNPRAEYRSAKLYLSDYVESGALSMSPIPDTNLNFYYFAMLGE